MSRIAHLSPDKSDLIFASHLEELLRRTVYEGPQFSFFLDDRQQEIAQCVFMPESVEWIFFGGFDEAQRCILGIDPSGKAPATERFPITPITIAASKGNTLSHRDVLGALMSLGYERRLIGDILTQGRLAVVFLCSHIAPAIVGECERIGKLRVTCELGCTCELPKPALIACEKVAGSLRLDSIVAAMVSVSRTQAQQLIEAKKVTHNARLADMPSRLVSPGDKISVRGIGKFLFENEKAKTKSGKYHISFFQYQ